MNLLDWFKNWLTPAIAPPVTSTAARQLQSRHIIKVPLTATPVITTATAASVTPTTAVADVPAEEEKNLLRTARLIMVSANNNNKFYEMKELADGTFTVTYGRVGTAGTVTSYPVKLWDRKLREKLQKGYADQTHLFAMEVADHGLEAIEHPGVRELMNFLMQAARQSIRHNYQVSAEQVTQLQVDQAQLILDQLVELAGNKPTVPGVNDLLLELYRIIPRRMSKVQNHLIAELNNPADREKLESQLAEEQATLDVMRGQVKVNAQRMEQKSQATDLLQSMGLHIEPVTEEAGIRHIREMMGQDAKKFHRAYAVVNHRSQKVFDDYLQKAGNKATRLFWHGSRNENWLSILGSGLALRPANAVITGKMFGYGLYFADKCRKSLNYTSLRGTYWARGTQSRAYMALYDVHIGNTLKIKNHEAWCYELTEDKLRKRGAYDSLFAQGGADLVNNEFIVYNEAQSTVRYLIELRD